MLNFPTATFVGQKFAPSGGPVYGWDGKKWTTFTPDLAVKVIASNLNPAMDGSGAAGTHAHYSREGHVHPTDTSRLALDNATFTGTLTATMLAATSVAINGKFTSTAKGHRLGTHGGVGAGGAVTQADAHILMYDGGGGNWCGWGVDASGNVWLRTGLSGSPAPVMYVGNDQVTVFRDSPTMPTPTAGDSSTRVATTAFVMGRTGGGSFYPLAGGTATGNVTFAGCDLWVHQNRDYGVLYLGNTGSYYLQWDGSNYNLNAASAYASNGRLWGTNDFGGSSRMPWNNCRLAFVGDYPHDTGGGYSSLAEPYNGCATTGTAGMNQGYGPYYRRYRQFQCYTNGWFGLGYA